MKKALTVILSIIFLNNLIFSQTSEVDKLLKNDPYDIKNVNITLLPFNDILPEMNMKLSADISYQYKQKFLVNFQYDFGFHLEADFKKYNSYEITGRYFFKTSEKLAKLKFPIDVKYNTFSKTVTSIKIPYQKLVSHGIRAGYYTSQNFSDIMYARSDDSEPFGSITINGPTIVSTKNIFIGYSIFSIIDVETDIRNKMGQRLFRARKNEWYFDVVYATSINYFIPTFFPTLLETKDIPYGFRTGWSTTSIKKFGTTLTYEVGYHPGLGPVTKVINNFYLIMKAGFTLPVKI